MNLLADIATSQPVQQWAYGPIDPNTLTIKAVAYAALISTVATLVIAGLWKLVALWKGNSQKQKLADLESAHELRMLKIEQDAAESKRVADLAKQQADANTIGLKNMAKEVSDAVPSTPESKAAVDKLAKE